MYDHQETSSEHWTHPKLYDHLQQSRKHSGILHSAEIIVHLWLAGKKSAKAFSLQSFLSTTCRGAGSKGHQIQLTSDFVNLQFTIVKEQLIAASYLGLKFMKKIKRTEIYILRAKNPTYHHCTFFRYERKIHKQIHIK